MSEEDKCKVCLGKRVVENTKVLEVAIEQGVPDSHDYIFYG
jgi:DnaJ-class molecular chaperone